MSMMTEFTEAEFRRKILHRRLSKLTNVAGFVLVGSYVAIKIRAAAFGIEEPRTADFILTAIWIVSALWIAGIACWLLIRFMVDEE